MATLPASDKDPEDNGHAAGFEPSHPAAPRPAPPDPFDPASLHLGSDYGKDMGVRKVITTIPCRKPNKSEFFQVRPGEKWRLTTAVLEVENGVERQTFLVARPLWADLEGEISPALVLTCVNRFGDLFLWRLKLPGPDGRTNTWMESAMRIATYAENRWCRLVSDTKNGHYSHLEATGDLPEPKWPDLSFEDILRVGFRDRFIDSPDHVILRQLRGVS